MPELLTASIATALSAVLIAIINRSRCKLLVSDRFALGFTEQPLQLGRAHIIPQPSPGVTENASAS